MASSATQRLMILSMVLSVAPSMVLVAALEAAEPAAAALLTAAQGELGSHYRSGKTMRSLKMVPQVPSGRTSVATQQLWGSKPAYWLASGTKAHLIEPRSRQALRFYSPKLGRTVFARMVIHPGQKSIAWREAAVLRAMPAVEVIARQAATSVRDDIKKSLRGLTG